MRRRRFARNAGRHYLSRQRVNPVSSLTTDKKKKDASGTYIKPPALLQNECFQTTLAPFLGNRDNSVIAIQGTSGKRAVEAVCRANRDITITRANIKVLRLMGFKSAAELELSTGGGWGVFFINRGEQLLLAIPSLGSDLSGPTCGGGDASGICHLRESREAW